MESWLMNVLFDFVEKVIDLWVSTSLEQSPL